jgi:hypothetical protein
MWKEAVIAQFEINSRHLPEIMKNLSNDSQWSGWDSKRKTPENKSATLRHDSACSVGHNVVNLLSKNLALLNYTYFFFKVNMISQNLSYGMKH